VFKEWKDELVTNGLRHAEYAWTVLQRILAVAKDRGKITTNPCEKGGRLYEPIGRTNYGLTITSNSSWSKRPSTFR
jgi:hypothetical protein